MKPQIERFIQTAIHSNPMRIVCGTEANSSGDVSITFNKEFVSKPVIFVQSSEDSDTEDYQPICYVKSWTMDGDYYTGCTVISDGNGSLINWLCIGVCIDGT